MGEGEGVEGAGEEGGGLVPPLEAEGPALNAVPHGEAVNVGQGGGGVEEGQLAPRLLADEEEELFRNQGEKAGLVLIAQEGGGEQPLAQNPQGLLPHRLHAGGQALEKQARQRPAAALQGLLRLVEALCVDPVVLQQGPHGPQGPGGHAGAGGGEEAKKLAQNLVQLPGSEPQEELAQVRGNVLGDLRLAGFQGLAQLHGHLVAPWGRQHGGHVQQGAARKAPDHHVFADLHEVGEVGGDMEGGFPLPPPGLVQQVLHAHGLQNPGRGGFQVVQEHAACGLPLVQQSQKAGYVQPQQLPQPGLEVEQGDGGGAVRRLHRPGHGLSLGGILLQHRQKPAAQAHGGGLLGGLPGFQPPGGVVRQMGGVPGGNPLHRQIQRRVHQGEGPFRVFGGGVLVVAEKKLGKAGEVPVRAAAQQGVRRRLGLVADHADLPGGQAAVRVNELFQVLRPKLKGPVLLGAGGRALGQLLAVAGEELGENPPHQPRRLASDVPVGLEQQLIEEFQGLLLLLHGPVGEVLPEDGHIGPDAPRVLLAPRRLQGAHEQPLPAQPVHEADVVVHRRPPQAQDHLVLIHQGGVLPGQERASGGFQGHVRAEALEIALEIPELHVYILVPPPFGGVHVVQLGEDHVKGVRQGEELCRLPAAGEAFLLHPEVSVDQNQRLGGKVFQLQVPDGVVRGDAPQGPQAPPGEPLVRVVVVEVGHPLPGPAAELSDVVARGSGGDEAQVDFPAPGLEGPGDRHGHMVDPGDVLAGAEGGHLPAQAEELVDILLPPAAEELAVVRRHGTGFQFLFRAEGEVQPEVKGQGLPLRVEEGPQELKEAQGPVPLGGGLVRVRLGIEKGDRRPVGAKGPALPRLRGQAVQDGAEGLQGLFTGNPLLDGRQGGQQGGPVQVLKQGLRPGAGQLLQKRLLLKGAGQVQAELFHGFLRSARRGPVVFDRDSIPQLTAGGKGERKKSRLPARRRKGNCRRDYCSGDPASSPWEILFSSSKLGNNEFDSSRFARRCKQRQPQNMAHITSDLSVRK